MAALPKARTANHPLVLIALGITTGILLAHYQSHFKLAVALIIVGLGFFLFAVWVYRRVAAIATASLMLSFSCAGYELAFVQEQAISPNRIVRMFERGELLPGEPVELTGSVNGEPESAPDGFYLNLLAEQFRPRRQDQTATFSFL